jgi:uncharacterized SAM-binding protein YcdF (DUF218 family)
MNNIPDSSVMIEPKARTTIANACYVKISFLETNNWNNNILITSEFHIKRASLIFSKALGNRYSTKYIMLKSELSRIELALRALSEGMLYIFQKVIFIGISDGDHQNILSRYQKLHLTL